MEKNQTMTLLIVAIVAITAILTLINTTDTSTTNTHIIQVNTRDMSGKFLKNPGSNAEEIKILQKIQDSLPNSIEAYNNYILCNKNYCQLIIETNEKELTNQEKQQIIEQATTSGEDRAGDVVIIWGEDFYAIRTAAIVSS